MASQDSLYAAGSCSPGLNRPRSRNDRRTQLTTPLIVHPGPSVRSAELGKEADQERGAYPGASERLTERPAEARAESTDRMLVGRCRRVGLDLRTQAPHAVSRNAAPILPSVARGLRRTQSCSCQEASSRVLLHRTASLVEYPGLARPSQRLERRGRP